MYEEVERSVPSDRPWVICCMLASLDGAVTVKGRSGALGGPADFAVLLALRARADAIVVGAGTLRAEEYGAIEIAEDARMRRLRRGQEEIPLLAVVSAGCRLDPLGDAWTGRRRNRLFTTQGADPGRLEAMTRVADVRVCDGGLVKPEAVLADLFADGHSVALLEGGPTLNGHFARAGLIDELCLTLSPLLVGGGRSIVAGEELGFPRKMRLESLHAGEGMLFARYLRD